MSKLLEAITHENSKTGAEGGDFQFYSETELDEIAIVENVIPNISYFNKLKIKMFIEFINDSQEYSIPEKLFRYYLLVRQEGIGDYPVIYEFNNLFVCAFPARFRKK